MTETDQVQAKPLSYTGRRAGFFLTLFLFTCSSLQLSAQLTGLLEKFHDAASEQVMVAAHRAAHRGGYPENSLTSIRQAIKLGVDIVELDVRLTKDSVVVLMHDETIDRTTNGTGRIADYTLSELREFRLKGKQGRLTDEVIPTFREALEVARGHILVDIDLKTERVGAVVRAVRETGTGKQVFYFDNNYELLEEVRLLEPNAMIMPRAYSAQMADSAIRLFDPTVVHIDRSFYTGEVTSMIRSSSARVWINLLGLPDLWIRLGLPGGAVKKRLKHGATILQTDEPEKLLTYLRRKNLHD